MPFRCLEEPTPFAANPLTNRAGQTVQSLWDRPQLEVQFETGGLTRAVSIGSDGWRWPDS